MANGSQGARMVPAMAQEAVTNVQNYISEQATLNYCPKKKEPVESASIEEKQHDLAITEEGDNVDNDNPNGESEGIKTPENVDEPSEEPPQKETEKLVEVQEREPVEEVVIDDPQISKVSGYLRKKGKLRLVAWKRYWFILEGRLLLYYRSKAEYDSLSPCKGSITLGSPCNIKPGSASNCIFQITTRNHTITLRADNRAEQDKWMLAILGALKQTSQTSRMSHFRYSADDLAMRTNVEKPPIPALIRQNTLPDRMGNNIGGKQSMATEKNIKRMVERIESIGGQSYTANQTLNPADHLKASKASPKLPKNNNLKKLLDKQLSVTSTKSDHGDWIREEDICETIENDLYATLGNADMADAIDPTKERHIYQEITNDEYVETEVIVENSAYAEMDHNKNKVEYWEPLYDSAKPEYGDGDGDGVVETVEPLLPPRPVQESTENDEKIEDKKHKPCKMTKRRSFVIRMFNRIKRSENSHKEDTKDKNSVSSLTDSSEKEVVENSTEEVIPSLEENTSALEICEHDKVVNVLPNVLKELNGVILAKDEDKIEEIQTIEDEQSQNEDDDKKIDTENNSEPASPQLEQLTQLQQPQLPLKQNQSEPESEPIEEPNENADEADEGEKSTHSDFDYDLYDPSQRLNIPRPKLICKPKKQKRLRVVSDAQLPIVRFYEQYTECLEYREQVPRLKDDNKLMTIDEILDDLENHNYEPFSRQKVKELIEKFNDTEHETDEDTNKDEEQIHVQLRRKRVEQTEELNSLLDELSKVANAPVSSPDSNILGDNGPFSEEEWKSIVPIRKRRHSDPDYDIPRPHSALQIIPSSEKEETRMQPTRFFGPVIIEQINGDTTSCGTSITPDSLEIDVLSYPPKNYTPSIEEDRSMRSYTSHIYASNDSHLNNNNYTHNSHINQKVTPGGGEYGPELNQDDLKPKSLSTLIVPKSECEQAFYLKDDNDKNNNNNQKLSGVVDDNEAPKFNDVVEHVGDIMSTSVCYDSLEPSAVDTQQ